MGLKVKYTLKHFFECKLYLLRMCKKIELKKFIAELWVQYTREEICLEN